MTKHSTYLLSFLFMFTFFIGNSQTVKTGLSFDGVDDYVRIPHGNALNLGTGEFTIEAWIQVEDDIEALAPIILAKKAGSLSANGFMFGLNDKGKLVIQIEGQSYFASSWGGVDLRDGQCHHVVYTRENASGSDTVRAYIDGGLRSKSVKSIPKTLNADNTDDLTIGWSEFTIINDEYYFKGMIKEVRVWNVRKSQSEISASMDKFLDGNESGLVGYWSLYENGGQAGQDRSGNGNNAVLGGGSGAEGSDPTWADFCDVIDDDLPGGSGPTGINDPKDISFTVYPNPFENQIIVESHGSDISTITNVRLLDVTSRVFVNRKNQTNGARMLIETGKLPSGIYFLELTMDDTTKEIIKLRR